MSGNPGAVDLADARLRIQELEAERDELAQQCDESEAQRLRNALEDERRVSMRLKYERDQENARILELEAAIVVAVRDKEVAESKLAVALDRNDELTAGYENNQVWRDMAGAISEARQDNRRLQLRLEAALVDSDRALADELWNIVLPMTSGNEGLIPTVRRLVRERTCTASERALVEAAVTFHEKNSKPFEPSLFMEHLNVGSLMSEIDQYRKLCEAVIAEREAKA